MKSELNGYKLERIFQKVQESHVINVYESSLFLNLKIINNNHGWAESFTVPNWELCSKMGISEKTLITARNGLIKMGLLIYTSGKSRKQHGIYSFLNIPAEGSTTVPQKVVNGQTTYPTTVPQKVVKQKKEPITYPTTVLTTVPRTDNNQIIKEETIEIEDSLGRGLEAPPPKNICKSFKNFTEEEFKAELEKFSGQFSETIIRKVFNHYRQIEENGKMYLNNLNRWNTEAKLQQFTDSEWPPKNQSSQNYKNDPYAAHRRRITENAGKTYDVNSQF